MQNEQTTHQPPTYAELRLAASEILNAIEENDGELTASDETTLQLIQNKLVAGCFAIDNRRQSISQAKEMIKELQGRVKAAEKTAAFLESVVVSTMQTMGQSKIESYKKFSLAKNPGRIDVFSPRDVPSDYCSAKIEVSFDLSIPAEYDEYIQTCKALDAKNIAIKPTITPSKTAIKDALWRGEVVPGAQLIDNEFSFRIK